MSANSTGAIRLYQQSPMPKTSGNFTTATNAFDTSYSGALDFFTNSNSVYGIKLNVAHTHNMQHNHTVNISHTHTISSNGGTESRSNNFTCKIWVRTA